jgi:hypothetical protein
LYIQEWLEPLHTATEVGPRPARRDEVGLTEVTLCFSNQSSRFVLRVDAFFFGRFDWQSLQMPLANISSYAVVRIYMDCQSVCGTLRLSNPILIPRQG